MTVNQAMTQGEYLGYCPLKGDIYSVPMQANHYGNKKYVIVCIRHGALSYLIDYTVS